MKPSKIKLPYWRRNRKKELSRLKKVSKIWNPSNGKIGNKLNKNNETFKPTVTEKKMRIKSSNNNKSGKKRIESKKSGYEAKAISKLLSGPAMETSSTPLLWFLKLPGLIGTGFAQPKRTSAIMINPTGSKCFKGFRVYLPEYFGVSSPHLTATKACANSCTGMVSIMARNNAINSKMSSINALTSKKFMERNGVYIIIYDSIIQRKEKKSKQIVPFYKKNIQKTTRYSKIRAKEDFSCPNCYFLLFLRAFVVFRFWFFNWKLLENFI